MLTWNNFVAIRRQVRRWRLYSAARPVCGGFVSEGGRTLTASAHPSTGSANEYLLEAHNIVFERQLRSVFGRVNLQVAGGETVLISGVNGAGKTTLLKLLAGILRPAEGSLRHDPLCFVGHYLGMKADLTAAENLRFYAAMYDLPGRDWLAALAAFDAEYLADKLVGSMSAGQRRRVALSRLHLSQRRLWLLDEPYANLDTEGCAQVDRALAAHTRQGGAAILASHGRAPQGVPVLREISLPQRAAPSTGHQDDEEEAC